MLIAIQIWLYIGLTGTLLIALAGLVRRKVQKQQPQKINQVVNLPQRSSTTFRTAA